MRPVVLVTADRSPAGFGSFGLRVRPRAARVTLSESYVRAVDGAGGLVWVCPPGEWPVDELLSRVDAVVLTGGHFDIHPSHYGQAVAGRLDRVDESRTSLELSLARACLTRGVPVLGVCGGMQAMAVAAGGTLVQHLLAPHEGGDGLEHEQPSSPLEPWHMVRWAGQRAWEPGVLRVNSTHHQAVLATGEGLRACGWSSDGVIEGIEGIGSAFALGVQWHPELLGDLRPYRALLASI